MPPWFDERTRRPDVLRGAIDELLLGHGCQAAGRDLPSTGEGPAKSLHWSVDWSTQAALRPLDALLVIDIASAPLSEIGWHSAKFPAHPSSMVMNCVVTVTDVVLSIWKSDPGPKKL